MLAWRDRLATLGTVETFDYPYMRAGRKSPDRLPVLLDAHRDALAGLRARAAGPVFLIGKSMGGRVGCHLALEADVAGVVCLGYPLRSGATGALRDEVLLSLRKPILFVQGTRDPLGPLDKLAEVRAQMKTPNTLVVVEGGNHSLEVPKGRERGHGKDKEKGGAQAASDGMVLDAIARFTNAIASQSQG
jgi:predicted alpha/beta-hydrolase family hydrolase